MKEKVKVVQYFWGTLDAGGAETFIVNLFSKIDRRQIMFDFVVYEDKQYFYSDYVEMLGGNIKALYRKNRKASVLPIRLIKRWIALYDLLKKENYTVFHCNCDFAFKFIEMYIAKKAGIKMRICHSHNSHLEINGLKDQIKYFLHKCCIPLLNRYTTTALACSEEAGKWLFGENRNDIIYIQNAVDTEKYRYNLSKYNEIRKDKGLEDSFVVGHIGRFFAVKNHMFLLDVFKEITKYKLEARLLLIGEGELKVTAEKKVKALGLEGKVWFVGTTHHVEEYLMAMDVFVMPSLFEGLPVAGIEAQAAGIPCVFSDTISRELALTSNVKFLSLDKTAQEWADEIIRMGNMKKCDNSEQVRKSGFDMRECARQLERIYMKN